MMRFVEGVKLKFSKNPDIQRDEPMLESLCPILLDLCRRWTEESRNLSLCCLTQYSCAVPCADISLALALLAWSMYVELNREGWVTCGIDGDADLVSNNPGVAAGSALISWHDLLGDQVLRLA
jgi:hypothetical protein